MGARLTCLEVWTPGIVRRRLLDELVAAVAAAFGCLPPRWGTGDYRGRLREFAVFTARRAGAALASGDRVRVEPALREAAERTGASLRRRLGVRTADEARRAMVLLYRHIGIRAAIAADGAVVVDACLFSEVYTADVCRLMCAVDDGVAAGLSGGGGLTFRRRLTEGEDACVGCFLASAAVPQCTTSAPGCGRDVAGPVT